MLQVFGVREPLSCQAHPFAVLVPVFLPLPLLLLSPPSRYLQNILHTSHSLPQAEFDVLSPCTQF